MVGRKGRRTGNFSTFKRMVKELRSQRASYKGGTTVQGQTGPQRSAAKLGHPPPSLQSPKAAH